MSQLNFPFPSVTEDGAANDASQTSDVEIGYFEQRSLHLQNALNLIDRAEVLLREAREEAGRSECRGIDYRLRRMFIKIVSLKDAILKKKRNLDKRDSND